MPVVYIETSIVSFLRDNPQADAGAIARQQITRQWWKQHRYRYELVASQYVVDEASQGNPALANERLSHLKGIPLVPVNGAIGSVAAEIIGRAILPPDAILDALHIACAAHYRVDYLLTWNCAHIANPMTLPQVFRVLDDFGLPFPVICTPEDMLNYDPDTKSD